MDCIKATCLVIFLGTVVCARFSIKDQVDWLSWKLKYNKNYKNDVKEIEYRAIWEKNKAYVEAHNKRDDVQFKIEMNQFADQETGERSLLHDSKILEREENNKVNGKLKFAPASWDWRQQGAVTPVQNQGMLGDAQAIVAAECVESYHEIHAKVLPHLSSAEVHDCCTPTGLINPQVFDCIHNIGGLCSAQSYPKPMGKCMNGTCSAVAQVEGGKKVTQGDENALKESVLITPVMAIIDASRVSFELYSSGIYDDPQCSSTQLDHVVQIVGYGSQNGTDYWICKNSWGINWGMKGYVLIARNKGNVCGIATMAKYPI